MKRSLRARLRRAALALIGWPALAHLEKPRPGGAFHLEECYPIDAH